MGTVFIVSQSRANPGLCLVGLVVAREDGPVESRDALRRLGREGREGAPAWKRLRGSVHAAKPSQQAPPT